MSQPEELDLQREAKQRQPRDPHSRDPHSRDRHPDPQPHPQTHPHLHPYPNPHLRDPHPHPRDPHLLSREPHPYPPDPQTHPRDPQTQARDPKPHPHPQTHPREPYSHHNPHSTDPQTHPRDPQIHPRDPHPQAHPRDLQTHHHHHPHSTDPQTLPKDAQAHPRDHHSQTHPWDPQDPQPHSLDHHSLCPFPLDPYHRDPIPRDTYRHPRDPHPQHRDPQPRSFLVSLRTLFDILDQEGRGSVELREIESRWPGEGRREAALPAGLMACLRRVAAPSGRLTFPRLLAGIRAALQQEACNPEADSVPGSPRYQMPGGTQKETPAAAKDRKGLGAPRRSSQEDQDLRHRTIANGGDDNMLKELECQRDALLHGLEVVEWARDWYRQQILALHQRQKHVRRVFGNKDQLAQPPQDRACRLLAKIQEVNCCLGDLICSSGKVAFSAPRVNGFGIPLRAQPFQQQSISSLKEQNHLLTKELSSKRERIAILEQEKASLVKRLIEAQERGQPASPPHRPYPHRGSEGTP